MEDMGDYQVLAHIETPEFSMRLLSLRGNGYVAPHYHDESKQLYAVLEGVVEITHGDRILRLCPYETTHIERQTVHNVRPVGGRALVVSICTPPLKLDDQHPVEYSDSCLSACSGSALPKYLQPVGQR
jgi:mannose-6-phosphate isomerase-like protein (cupin superfamily)